MTDDKIKVNTPEKWMDGWNQQYKRLLKEDDLTKLEYSYVHYPVQQLFWFNHGRIENDKKERIAFELACGDGRVSCFLAQNGYTVEAIDALPSAIELTHKRMKQLGLSEDQIKVSLANMDNLVLEQETYDVIIALQCLQYLFGRAIPKIQEILAAIKPGGFFVYSGNIPPHEKTEPPMHFITRVELETELKGWIIHSIGENIVRLSPEKTRGYLFVVAQKLLLKR
ncbi:MAG: class I SAM-dependent methyltransferase [Candidatus Hodarchaeota archaeon]